MSNKVLVAGVGMVKFTKPGKSEMYDVMGAQAIASALKDAGIQYDQVQQAYAGFVSGDTCSGQTALYHAGLTQIPIINVNNACASGSSALFLARQAVMSGVVDVALAVGFEQMNPGALAGSDAAARTPITVRIDEATRRIRGWDDQAPTGPQYFGGAGAEYMEKYNVSAELFGRVSVKARSHAARNPYALFTDPLTLEQVMGSPAIFGPLTRLMCCPPTCGAAATVVVSEAYARKHGLANCVEIAGMSLTTDGPQSYESGSMIEVVGAGMTSRAAQQAYAQAGVGPQDLDLVELHDCFSSNEIISYEALGLCAEGGSERFVLDGDNTYGGQVVTNPSGGLLSKGHPLGATGLAQIAEVSWHLRGLAGDRQVPGARLGLQHNVGLGGACVVTILKKL
ncbi:MULTISPECIES: lipid-transfer protein [unclassified Pseudomonas]|uniref:lipid-transfer protein n=1 Tax=unclassified Pseudomonas TaxID=196821 RepID=UPI0018E766CE|nr:MULTISPECIES: lipid-transfer protein [unclassified Pseudomonas]MBJ2303748.1 lipid-transfer protein [Pseudomonas sp. MF2846]MBK3490259.1 lipid-transfer protein [Pseudomonas sp. MF2857]